MRCLVVCESMFGNTRRVGEAIVVGLVARGADATVYDVADAPSQTGPDVDLLVVGGPTHAHGLSRVGTRQSAAQQALSDYPPSRTGLREWLAAYAPAGKGVPFAAFDTRYAKPRWLTGSAARATDKRLRQLGCTPVAARTSFYVETTTGPLRDNELERARRWGEDLATTKARAGS